MKKKNEFIKFIEEKSEYEQDYSNVRSKLKININKPYAPRIRLDFKLAFSMALTFIIAISLILIITNKPNIIIEKQPDVEDNNDNKENNDKKDNEEDKEPSEDPEKSDKEKYINNLYTSSMNPYYTNIKIDNDSVYEKLSLFKAASSFYIYNVTYNKPTSGFISGYISGNNLSNIKETNNFNENEEYLSQILALKQKSELTEINITWYKFDEIKDIPQTIDELSLIGIVYYQEVDINKELITNINIDEKVFLFNIYHDTVLEGEYLLTLEERLTKEKISTNMILNTYITQESQNLLIEEGIISINDDYETFKKENLQDIYSDTNKYDYDLIVNQMNNYLEKRALSYEIKPKEVHTLSNFNAIKKDTLVDGVWNNSTMSFNNGSETAPKEEFDNVDYYTQINGNSVLLEKNNMIIVDLYHNEENDFSCTNLNVSNILYLNNEITIIFKYDKGEESNQVKNNYLIFVDKKFTYNKINIEVIERNDQLSEDELFVKFFK